MTENEIISKWRGECYHYGDVFIRHVGLQNLVRCSNCNKEFMANENPRTDYDSDPAAWTPKLFQAIEDAGLCRQYPYQLWKVLGMDKLMPCDSIWIIWATQKATPAQKSTALARAIQEGE